MQVLTAVAPCVPEYLPAPQFVQVLATVAPPVPEYLPVPQSVHMAEPVSVLYFPNTQAVHVPPSCPEYPVLQKQKADAIVDCVYIGQVIQVLPPMAPIVVEYLPAPQAVQGALPVPAL